MQVVAEYTQQDVEEACQLLKQQLSNAHPCVVQASIVVGVLQDRLFAHSTVPFQAATREYMQRFQELFVQPAVTKIAKSKSPQDKIVALAKFLRGKLAKAPAHKQPLHTQYLTSALRDTGKRQLDCLGIATTVLGLCQQIATQWPAQHSDLEETVMFVSDDHCWLGVPATQQPQVHIADTGNREQQQQLVFVEVTDPGVLSASQMENTWLYASGHGMQCSMSQVVMVLVAGLMPEEVQDDAAAQQLRAVQMLLLMQLSTAHPQALFYSNYFRWGMLHEEVELEQLAAAAHAAASTGDMQTLEALASPPSLQSQEQYARAASLSNGWMWHPYSCAAFGRLNRMQAALCGETDDLMCNLQQPMPGIHPWLRIAVLLWEPALVAIDHCTAVLRRFSGCASKPNKAANTQLMEAVTDLWQNLADASQAVAYLHYIQEQQETGVEYEWEASVQSSEPGNASAPSSLQKQQQGPAGAGTSGVPTAEPATDMPSAAEHAQQVHVSSHTLDDANTFTQQQHLPQHPHNTRAVLSNPAWLQSCVGFLDALLCFFGEDSADVPVGPVADFVVVAGAFSRGARMQAVQSMVEKHALHSSRVQGLLGSTTWEHLEPGLQQLLQMPGGRARTKRRRD